jgi:hypothetical protein
MGPLKVVETGLASFAVILADPREDRGWRGEYEKLQLRGKSELLPLLRT